MSFEEPKTIRQSRQRPSVHGSRLDETWTEAELHGIEDRPWERGGAFPKIEARPGFTQRWIRVASFGIDDPTNLSRKLQEGWKPRHPDTLPSKVKLPTISHGEWAGCIGIEGSILCEMPEVLAKKKRLAVRDRTKRINDGIEAELQREQRPNTVIDQDRRSEAGFARVVKAADD